MGYKMNNKQCVTVSSRVIIRKAWEQVEQFRAVCSKLVKQLLSVIH